MSENYDPNPEFEGHIRSAVDIASRAKTIEEIEFAFFAMRAAIGIAAPDLELINDGSEFDAACDALIDKYPTVIGADEHQAVVKNHTERLVAWRGLVTDGLDNTLNRVNQLLSNPV